MEKHSTFVLRVSLFAGLFLSACNGGTNLTIQNARVEDSPIVVDDPANPQDPNSPTLEKNRIFVTTARVKAINTESAGFFNYVCYREAMRAGIQGAFVALVKNANGDFPYRNRVKGFLYQKFMGVENRVADSLDDLFNGRNDSIYATALQLSINTASNNTVWIGGRGNNCGNWSSSEGEAVVGRAGRSGSDAVASEMQTCNTFSRLYCVQVN